MKFGSEARFQKFSSGRFVIPSILLVLVAGLAALLGPYAFVAFGFPLLGCLTWAVIKPSSARRPVMFPKVKISESQSAVSI